MIRLLGTTANETVRVCKLIKWNDNIKSKDQNVLKTDNAQK